MVTKTPEKTELKENQKQQNIIIQNENINTINNSTENIKPKRNLSTITIFGILLGIFILLIVICFFIFSFSLKKNSNIFSGIYIKNINVSNLNKQDAKNKIDTYINNNIPEEITLKHNDYETTIPTSELKINFDTSSAVKIAYNFGRNGNIISDGYEVIQNSIFNKNIEPNFSIDEDALKNMLNNISSNLPDKVIESGYYIEDNNLIINKGSEGNIIDTEKSIEIIKNHINNLTLTNNKIELATKSAKPTKLNIDDIYSKIHKEPIDASFSIEPRSITPSENGIDFAISMEEAKSKFNEENQECTIPLKIVYPNITTNMISTEAFPDELSNFHTYYDARNYNRTTNLILAANKINGTVLMPGEIFSYNQVVGERSIAAGYKEAPIYVSGRVEDGLGGGICQITTTLYNAVVYANLEIIERTNHQFVPSYVGAGRDATVVYGAIDFKFKNNRNYPIKIVCSVNGGIATFQILGLKTDNEYNVEIYSKITSQTTNNINSETYKILRQNGVIVEEKLLSKDIYKKH